MDWKSARDAFGSAGPLPAVLSRLWSPEAEELFDTWNELLSRIWHQGSVYDASEKAIAPLLTCARCSGCPGRACAAALLCFVATGHGEPEVEARIRKALADRREDLAELKSARGIPGDAATLLCDLLDGLGAGPAWERAMQLAGAVEASLYEAEESDRRAQRTPGRIREELSHLPVADREGELRMLGSVHEALDLGLAADVVEACSKLRHVTVLAEPYRIRALAATGKSEEARRAAVALAQSWLDPPKSKEAINQPLLRVDILRVLEAVMGPGDQELAALRDRVRSAEQPTFVAEGDEL